jgi:hypothetical protein
MNAAWRELEKDIETALKQHLMDRSQCIGAGLNSCDAVAAHDYYIAALSEVKKMMAEIESKGRAERVADLLEVLDYHKWGSGYDEMSHDVVLRGFGEMVKKTLRTGDTTIMEGWRVNDKS